MPNRCVAAGCGSTPDIKNGIVLHAIPFCGDERPIAKKRRRQWVDFVKLKRAKWEATPNSRLCSKHFRADDFMRRFNYLEGQGEAIIPRLTRDEIGVVPVPRIHATTTVSKSTSSTSSRSRAHRQLVRSAINDSAIASIPLAANQAELSQVSSSQEQPDNMAMDIHEDSDAQETETDLRRMQAAEVLASFFSRMDSPL